MGFGEATPQQRAANFTPATTPANTASGGAFGGQSPFSSVDASQGKFFVNASTAPVKTRGKVQPSQTSFSNVDASQGSFFTRGSAAPAKASGKAQPPTALASAAQPAAQTVQQPSQKRSMKDRLGKGPQHEPQQPQQPQPQWQPQQRATSNSAAASSQHQPLASRLGTNATPATDADGGSWDAGGPGDDDYGDDDDWYDQQDTQSWTDHAQSPGWAGRGAEDAEPATPPSQSHILAQQSDVIARERAETAARIKQLEANQRKKKKKATEFKSNVAPTPAVGKQPSSRLAARLTAGATAARAPPLSQRVVGEVCTYSRNGKAPRVDVTVTSIEPPMPDDTDTYLTVRLPDGDVRDVRGSDLVQSASATNVSPTSGAGNPASATPASQPSPSPTTTTTMLNPEAAASAVYRGHRRPRHDAACLGPKPPPTSGRTLPMPQSHAVTVQQTRPAKPSRAGTASLSAASAVQHTAEYRKQAQKFAALRPANKFPEISREDNAGRKRKLAELDNIEQQNLARLNEESTRNGGFDPDKIGSCRDMCPEAARYALLDRCQYGVDEGSIHWLETTAFAPFQKNGYTYRVQPELDHSRVVKDFKKVAADAPPPLPSMLRPEWVLDRTMQYLCREVMAYIDTDDLFNRNSDQADKAKREWHKFLEFRTRAIRQDMTIQGGMTTPGGVRIFERIIRFHIFAGHYMCECKEYIDQQNSEQMGKAFKTLTDMYGDVRATHGPQPNESEFRAYTLLKNLNKPSAFGDVENWPPDVINSKEVQFAIMLFSLVQRGSGSVFNYARFFKLARETTLLNACILNNHFVWVRQHALKLMNHGFSNGTNKPGSIPIAKVTRLLGFDDVDATETFLDLHGMACSSDGTVDFVRGVAIEPHGALAKKNFTGWIGDMYTMHSLGELVYGEKIQGYCRMAVSDTFSNGTAREPSPDVDGFTEVGAAATSSQAAALSGRLGSTVAGTTSNTLPAFAPTSAPDPPSKTTVVADDPNKHTGAFGIYGGDGKLGNAPNSTTTAIAAKAIAGPGGALGLFGGTVVDDASAQATQAARAAKAAKELRAAEEAQAAKAAQEAKEAQATEATMRKAQEEARVKGKAEAKRREEGRKIEEARLSRTRSLDRVAEELLGAALEEALGDLFEAARRDARHEKDLARFQLVSAFARLRRRFEHKRVIRSFPLSVGLPAPFSLQSSVRSRLPVRPHRVAPAVVDDDHILLFQQLKRCKLNKDEDRALWDHPIDTTVHGIIKQALLQRIDGSTEGATWKLSVCALSHSTSSPSAGPALATWLRRKLFGCAAEETGGGLAPSFHDTPLATRDGGGGDHPGESTPQTLRTCIAWAPTPEATVGVGGAVASVGGASALIISVGYPGVGGVDLGFWAEVSSRWASISASLQTSVTMPLIVMHDWPAAARPPDDRLNRIMAREATDSGDPKFSVTVLAVGTGVGADLDISRAAEALLCRAVLWAAETASIQQFRRRVPLETLVDQLLLSSVLSPGNLHVMYSQARNGVDAPAIAVDEINRRVRLMAQLLPEAPGVSDAMQSLVLPAVGVGDEQDPFTQCRGFAAAVAEDALDDYTVMHAVGMLISDAEAEAAEVPWAQLFERILYSRLSTIAKRGVRLVCNVDDTSRRIAEALRHAVTQTAATQATRSRAGTPGSSYQTPAAKVSRQRVDDSPGSGAFRTPAETPATATGGPVDSAVRNSAMQRSLKRVASVDREIRSEKTQSRSFTQMLAAWVAAGK